MPRGVYPRKKTTAKVDGTKEYFAGKRRKPLSPQQRAALTRKRNARKNSRYVEGYLAGYLLGLFDGKHDVARHTKQLERLAESGSHD